MKMYSLYDCKSMQFTHPFGQVNDVCAMRVVKNDIRREGTLVGSNPEDFDLYYLGDFDEQQGRFIALDLGKLVVKCDRLVETGAE